MKNYIGIDFGANRIYVYSSEKRMTVCIPTVMALDKRTGAVLALGDEAFSLCDRIPGSTVLIYPFRRGIDFSSEYFKTLLDYSLSLVKGRRNSKTKVFFSVKNATDDDAINQIILVFAILKYSDVKVIDETVLDALGCGSNIAGGHADLVVDIGATYADISVVKNGVCYIKTLCSAGGNAYDAAVASFVARKNGLKLKQEEAARIKEEIGTVWPSKKIIVLASGGINVSDGLPNTVRLYSNEIFNAFREPIKELAKAITTTLNDKTITDDIRGDITSRGIFLVGNGSKLSGMKELIGKISGIDVRISDNPGERVLDGLIALEDYSDELIEQL